MATLQTDTGPVPQGTYITAVVSSGDGPACGEDLFWSKIDIRGEDECWPWKLGLNSHGYGQIMVTPPSRPTRAHRIAFEKARGESLGKSNGLHICDNPPCCNPKHIWSGTKAENSRDMAIKGRSTIGARNPQARLSDQIVKEIRAAVAAGESQASVGRRYGVIQQHVSDICLGKRWGHVA